MVVSLPYFCRLQGWVIYMKTGWPVCLKNQPSRWVIPLKADKDTPWSLLEIQAPWNTLNLPNKSKILPCPLEGVDTFVIGKSPLTNGRRGHG